MEIDNKAKALGIAILLFAIVLATIPQMKDDTEKHKLVDVDTKQEVYQQKMSESFIVAVFLCVLAPFLILQFLEASVKVPKRRSLLEIYNSIPESEKIKFGLPSILSKQFSEILFMPTDEGHALLRYPSHTKGFIYNILVDAKDDYLSRNTISPIYSIWMENVGIDRAKSILGVKGETLGKFVQQAKGYGLTPEDIRARLLQRQAKLEEERSSESIESPEGGV